MARSPKKLLNAEEPAFSLSYINWLIQVHNLDLDFDFYLNDKNPQAEFTAFSYTLNGEGKYRDIFFADLVHDAQSAVVPNQERHIQSQ